MQESNSSSNAYLSKELQKRNEEISQLKKSLSDIQVYLYQEREQVLKLFSENDILKLKRYEDRKKIQLLLSFCGKTDGDIKITEINHMDLPRLHSSILLSKNLKNKQTADDATPLETLQLVSNAAHYEECISLYKEQIDLLIADRELVSKERAVEQEVMQEHMDMLNHMLLDKESQLNEMKIVMNNCKGHIDKIKTKHKYNSNQKLTDSYNDNMVLYRRAVEEVAYLKKQLSYSDVLVERLTNQKELLSSELSKQKELHKQSLTLNTDRIDKLTRDLTYQKRSYASLEKRRILEAEGFRSDIKFMRQRMSELEKLILKVRTSPLPVITGKSQLGSKSGV